MRTLPCSAAICCLFLAGSASTALPPLSPPSAAGAPAQRIRPPSPAAPSPSDYAGLHNVVAFAPGFYSGSAPDQGRGFESLRALGIKTIISVDGATPDLSAARAAGLRYMHLPIGYSGMDHGRALELARAVKLGLAAGPVYLHCHHGKHRAAAAAGAAAVTLGLLSNEQAAEKLRICGTSPAYAGLYRCVEAAGIAAAAELDAIPCDFPEVSRPDGFIGSMVEIDQAFDHLVAIEASGWSVPPDHPDLAPAAEAGRLADRFRMLADAPITTSRPAEFKDLLARASATAARMEDLLAGPDPGAAPNAAALGAALKVLGRSCAGCHATYRD